MATRACGDWAQTAGSAPSDRFADQSLYTVGAMPDDVRFILPD